MEPSGSRGWSKHKIFSLFVALIMLAGIIGILIWKANVNDDAVPPKVVRTFAATFQPPCIGAYSDVEFSEDDGDGSGLFVRIPEKGRVTIDYWEGGPSTANVDVIRASRDFIEANVTFDQSARQTYELRCNSDFLLVNIAGADPEKLRRLTEKQAAELEAASKPEPLASDRPAEPAETGETINATASTFTPDEQKLIDAYLALEKDCRGGTGADQRCDAWANGNPIEAQRLRDVSICLGHKGQADSDYEFHHCDSNSIPM